MINNRHYNGSLVTCSNCFKLTSFQSRAHQNRYLSGYIQTGLKINNVYKTIAVHILVARVFIPNTENKPHVNHINGIKHDNRVDNLEWVTPKENSERRIFPNHGRIGSRKIVQKR